MALTAYSLALPTFLALIDGLHAIGCASTTWSSASFRTSVYTDVNIADDARSQRGFGCEGAECAEEYKCGEERKRKTRHDWPQLEKDKPLPV